MCCYGKTNISCKLLKISAGASWSFFFFLMLVVIITAKDQGGGGATGIRL